MAVIHFVKQVLSLPAQLEPNTLYFVRVGAGFDLYLSDATGSVAHKLNADALPDVPHLPAADMSIDMTMLVYQPLDSSLLGYTDGTPYHSDGYAESGYASAQFMGSPESWKTLSGKPILDGAPGLLPTGGVTGAVLRKASDMSKDVEWHTLTASDVGAEPAIQLPQYDQSLLLFNAGGSRSWMTTAELLGENPSREEVLKLIFLFG